MPAHTSVSASAPASSSASLALVAACGAGVRAWRGGTGALVVNVLVAKHGFTPENISFWRFAIGTVVLLAGSGRLGSARGA